MSPPPRRVLNLAPRRGQEVFRGPGAGRTSFAGAWPHGLRTKSSACLVAEHTAKGFLDTPDASLQIRMVFSPTRSFIHRSSSSAYGGKQFEGRKEETCPRSSP